MTDGNGKNRDQVVELLSQMLAELRTTNVRLSSLEATVSTLRVETASGFAVLGNRIDALIRYDIHGIDERLRTLEARVEQITQPPKG